MFNVQISKIEKTLEVDFDNFDEKGKAYIIAYGLKQALNDAHASITKAEVPNEKERLAQVEDAVNQRLEKIQSGKIAERAVRAVLNPVEKEFNRLAWAELRTVFKTTTAKIKEALGDKTLEDALKIVAVKRGYKNDNHLINQLRKTAEEIVSNRTTDAEAIDLESLLK